jgi:hypothetical protein
MVNVILPWYATKAARKTVTGAVFCRINNCYEDRSPRLRCRLLERRKAVRANPKGLVIVQTLR